VDALKNLQELGFNEYEARAYLGLLQQPDSSGYEVSRRSGVPRSRIYEVLQGLVHKGAATVTDVNGKLVYRPLAHDLLLARFRQRVAEITAGLESELARLAAAAPEPTVTALSGYEHALARVKEICERSRFRLSLGGMPPELTALAPELARAQQRGVKVFALSYGACRLPIENVYEHPVTPLQHLQLALTGRFLGVVSDHDEAALVLAAGGPGDATGVWGRNQGLVMALTFWIQHDVQLLEYGHHLGERVLDQIPEAVHQRLLDMVMLRPGELGQLEDTGTLPGPQQVLEGVCRRMNATPLAYQAAAGTYCFELRGEGGGTYYLRVTPGGCRLEAGPADADLKLRMSARDFSALALGKLPPIALMERGRVGIAGDLGLAAQLRLLLRGS
jgi:sugar-specific transcriptional regulator TrmB